MAPVKIKHAQFLYYTEHEYTDPNTGERKTRLSRRIASRGQTVDITRDEDMERGEATGAFETTGVRDAAVAGDEAAAPEPDEVEEASTGEPTAAEAQLDFSDQDALVAYLQEQKPTVVQTVALADGDPDRAEALMDAEDTASGGQPRAGVMQGLQKILDAEDAGGNPA